MRADPPKSNPVVMPFDYTLELPNDLRAIERAVNYLIDRGQEVGFDDDRLRLNFRVGLTEALANAMLYGNAATRANACVSKPVVPPMKSLSRSPTKAAASTQQPSPIPPCRATACAPAAAAFS